MQTTSINIKNIKSTNSKYFFCQPTKWDDNNPEFFLLKSSLSKLGQILPILVRADSNGNYDLVDGYKRFLYAANNNHTSIYCNILPLTAPETEVIKIILKDYHNLIISSPINKIFFITFCLKLGLSDEIIISHFFPALDLYQNHKVWQQYKQISKLPKEALSFFHEKKFPFKLCFHLSLMPKELILKILSLRNELHLTASNFLELAENLNDYLRNHNQTIQDFMKNSELKNILTSTNNNHEKTLQVRNIIAQKRFPTLTKINQNITNIKESMNLPKSLHLSWDNTLEEKEVKLNLSVKDNHDLETIIQHLNKKDLQTKINIILDEL